MERMTIPMEELMKVLELQLQNGQAELTVTGDSMYPTLWHLRDKVYLERLTRPAKKRDLILYRRENGQYVLHRIVGKRKNGYWCCGDNQWEKEAVDREQIIAVVCRIRRNGKEIAVEDAGYDFRIRLWTAMMPVRRPVLAVRGKIGAWRRGRRRRTCAK